MIKKILITIQGLVVITIAGLILLVFIIVSPLIKPILYGTKKENRN